MGKARSRPQLGDKLTSSWRSRCAPSVRNDCCSRFRCALRGSRGWQCLLLCSEFNYFLSHGSHGGSPTMLGWSRRGWTAPALPRWSAGARRFQDRGRRPAKAGSLQGCRGDVGARARLWVLCPFGGGLSIAFCAIAGHLCDVNRLSRTSAGTELPVSWLVLAILIPLLHAGCAHDCPSGPKARSYEDICGFKCKNAVKGQPYFDCITECLDECVPAE